MPNHEWHEPHESAASRRGLRAVRGPVAALALLLLLGSLSGCLGAYRTYSSFNPDPEYKNPGVFPGNYTFGNVGSAVLRGGPLKAGTPEVVHLRSTIPAYPGPAGEQTSDGTVLISLAVWRPQNVTTPVPVIVDAGPYYEQGMHCRGGATQCTSADLVNDTIDWQGQSTPWSIKNFLPYGYAVAQVAVRGTGTAGGCMDLMGPAEVNDLKQAIDWLGEQPWSNGNVAMIGTSYDGSTPWEVAATGDPHLKTIVPDDGLPDMFDLMFRNGSVETRGPGMLVDPAYAEHSAGYWGFGFSDGFPQTPKPPVPLPVDPPVDARSAVASVFHGGANGREQYQDLQNLVCPKAYEGATMGAYSWAAGDRGSAASQYWAERDHRAGVLANYKGSVFLVHGLQDWNVDPHAAIPFNAQLRAAGVPMKELYGQWNHNTPDGLCQAHVDQWATLPCRLDYAELMLRWFNHYLKGDASQELGPALQVQDDVGYWRNVDAFPPKEPAWTELHLGADGNLGSDAPGEATLTAGSAATDGTVLRLKGPVLADDLRVSGLPQVRLPFQPQGPGGQLAAWLLDVDGNGSARAPYAGCDPKGKCLPAGIPVIGHGQLNLRYYAGGEAPQALVPGQTYVAKLEMEPLDVLVPRGHHLELWVFEGQYPDHMATMTPSPIKVLLGGDAMLRLPVVAVDPTTIFPVPGIHFPARALYDRLDILPPPAPPTNMVTTPLTPPLEGGPTAVGACRETPSPAGLLPATGCAG